MDKTSEKRINRRTYTTRQGWNQDWRVDLLANLRLVQASLVVVVETPHVHLIGGAHRKASRLSGEQLGDLLATWKTQNLNKMDE